MAANEAQLSDTATCRLEYATEVMLWRGGPYGRNDRALKKSHTV